MNTRSLRSTPKILVAFIIAFASTFALAQMSDWRAPPSVANRPNPVPVNATTIELGKKLFVANCLTCHGPEGHGDGPGSAALEKKPADLPKRIKESGEKDGELFWKISEGRAPMVTWKTQLSETQRWELVNYIRATFAK
jgi:mono/diheme cytochrome c family protein